MKKSDIIEDEIERLKGADSLADTPFSNLFHEARTSTPANAGTHGWSSVACQVRVEGREVATSSTVKTRQGEHLRGTDRYDGIVSLVVQPFMETRTARQEIIRQLKQVKRTYLYQEMD